MSRTTNTPGEYVTVDSYDDIDDVSDRVREPEKNTVKQLLNGALPEEHDVVV